jgi:hypothetical protein
MKRGKSYNLHVNKCEVLKTFYLCKVIDFNARIGDNQDFDDRIDCIPEKQSIDSVKNKFGDFLLDFLSDCQDRVIWNCCTGGGFNLEFTNYIRY